MTRSRLIAVFMLCTIILCSGCGRFRRPCNSNAPSERALDREVLPRDGFIRPRDTEPIPSPSVPTTPRGDRPFEPTISPGRRDTYSPSRPIPRLEWGGEAFSPTNDIPNSPSELPSTSVLPVPTESFKQPLPPRRSGKFWITPDEPRNELPAQHSFKLEPLKFKWPTEQIQESETSLPTIRADATERPSRYPDLIDDSPKSTTSGTQSYAVGLDRFTEVKGQTRVATGDKPTLEGLDWLRKNKYRTVIYFHQPNRDTKPAQELCIQRGLKLIAIPLSPITVATALKAFHDALRDRGEDWNYVCDDGDGFGAGLLWYGYFRKFDLLGPDTSLVRAQSLGLSETTSSEHATLWLALQRELEKE